MQSTTRAALAAVAISALVAPLTAGAVGATAGAPSRSRPAPSPAMAG